MSIQAVINGLTNNLPSTLRVMNVNGSSMNISDVVARFQAILVVLLAVTKTKVAYAAAVAARKAEEASDHVFYKGVITNLEQIFGPGNSAALAPFGIAPPKPRAAPSTATKAIATVKAKATRTARGTLGKKQKQAITAEVQPSLQVFNADGKPLDPATGTPLTSAPTTVPSTPAPPTSTHS
jgi:hypothetical protein